MNRTDVARIAHELNKAYCESIGDNSQPDWDKAPEWQKSSAENGVKFHLENPEAPCFVPYDQLPVEQKAKDYIFRQTIHSLKPFITE